MRRILLMVVVVVLAGCGINQQPTPTMHAQCSSPRPQVCTMEYAPVCATRTAGGAHEYASGCNACADDSVESYIPGPCAKDSQEQ